MTLSRSYRKRILGLILYVTGLRLLPKLSVKLVLVPPCSLGLAHVSSYSAWVARLWVFLPWAPSSPREGNLEEKGWRKRRNWDVICCGQESNPRPMEKADSTSLATGKSKNTGVTQGRRGLRKYGSCAAEFQGGVTAFLVEDWGRALERWSWIVLIVRWLRPLESWKASHYPVQCVMLCPPRSCHQIKNASVLLLPLVVKSSVPPHHCTPRQVTQAAALRLTGHVIRKKGTVCPAGPTHTNYEPWLPQLACHLNCNQ